MTRHPLSNLLIERNQDALSLILFVQYKTRMRTSTGNVNLSHSE